MNLLHAWMESAAAKALGATLLHSLWEGAAVAFAVVLVMLLTRSPRIRYVAACLAMVAIIAGFVVTFHRAMPHDTGLTTTHVLPRTFPQTPDVPTAQSIRSNWDASDLLQWLAPVWMAGVLLFQVRSLASWLAAGRLSRTGVCSAPDRWISILNRLRLRLRMTKAVRLVESCLAEVPVVIGHFEPVILMPIGLLDRLPLGQIESILLHELAHIRRADYLVNLLQTLMEGLLFYHPAVWWISSVIRTERENCCDDLVVATSGDAHEYATALAALAENRLTMRDAAMAATGGSLVKRIRRLLAQPEGPRVAAPALSAAVLVVTCAVALAAWEPGQQGSPLISPTIPSPAVPVLQSQIAPQPSIAVVTEKQQAAMEMLRALQHRTVQLARIYYQHPQSYPMAFVPFFQISPNPNNLPYTKWLNEEVVYIITDAERNAFKSLRTDDERNMFIRQFWARRDPSYPTAAPGEYPVIAKGNPENEFKKEHYRRIKYVNDRFADQKIPGWKTDRGRIYIQYGPPDEIESHPTGGPYTRPPQEGGGQIQTHPFEQWMYRSIEGIGKNVIMEFVDTTGSGEYRLTMDPHEKDVAPAKQEEAKLSYKDLEAAVITGGRMYNGLPMKVQVSYTPLSSSVVMTQVTVQFDTKDLHFQDKDNVSTATINIYGYFSTLARRPLEPFDDVVTVKHATTDLPKFMEANPAQLYQKTLPLQPGRYRLTIVAKDVGTQNRGTYAIILDVPQGATVQQ